MKKGSLTAPFSTLLVANRGEIALRVMRSARARGLGTVAVYSEADRDAAHVQAADRAVAIGASPASESYLSIERIIEAAKKTGAGAVHPGYGFLAENADFAAACAQAGLVFVGPSAEAIRLMGNKRLAKDRLGPVGVAGVPGYNGKDQNDKALKAAARKIGYPLLVKAAAGGGGRGMRLVEQGRELGAALKSARSEAKSAFGSGELILERALINCRHVEIQIIADSFGTVLHLGERDCSVQRRHQKVIEETPSPAVKTKLRQAMSEAAVKAAAAIGYVGAGTVEFLLDGNDFYFLEMNTRLQVEHPVTEMVTGIDLVDWQLRVAAGERLPLEQEQIKHTGHAIEARLYAEDPQAGFLPQTGRVLRWRQPSGSGTRVDHGILEGQEISAFYDPMIGKLVAHGENREQARRRLVRALSETTLFGPTTNKAFLVRLLDHPEFARGKATTAFLDRHLDALLSDDDGDIALALAAVLFLQRQASGDFWRNSGVASWPLKIESGGEEMTLDAAGFGGGRFKVSHDEWEHEIVLLEDDGARLRFRVDGVVHSADSLYEPGGECPVLFLDVDGAGGRFVETTYLPAASRVSEGEGRIVAPMSGRIVTVGARKGRKVKKGDCLLILEAMKIEHEIASDVDGKVTNVAVSADDQVTPQQLLVEVEAA
ncbi:MAG: 3-methylcrotonyl-CoA carboxylase [Rhodospirillaceae bacterium]|nr:3-methylcrotonyl-CoA carboxylase [Rhodospirillaceae bacterium]